MEIGLIGLGKMGGNMAERLVKHGHTVLGCDPSPEAQERVRKVGVETAGSIAELVGKLKQTPKVVWAMVKSGDVTEKVLLETANMRNRPEAARLEQASVRQRIARGIALGMARFLAEE